MQKKISNHETNLLETYFKQLKAFPLLSFDEELELSKKIHNKDNEALHKLVNSNLRLVVKIASLYKIPDIPFMDIVQEGNLGLLHAAKKYDFRRNVRFCTYASWWIRQFISRYISNKRRLIRLPQRKEETLRRIQYTYHFLTQSLMHQPKNADIAKELGISVQDVDAYTNMTSEFIPFDQHLFDDQSVNGVDIHEDYTYCPERTLMKEISRESTNHVLRKLKENERNVINYRYQLNGHTRHTLREIGDKFNISPETVRQIERRALRKIRKFADELRDSVYVDVM